MEYILVRTPEEGEPFLEQLKKAPVLAVDTETTGLDVHRDRLRLIQLGAPGMRRWIPVFCCGCGNAWESSFRITGWRGWHRLNLHVRRRWPGRNMMGSVWIWSSGRFCARISRSSMRSR